MKRKHFVILFFIFGINFAHAGGVDGGGGKSVVCNVTSSNGVVLSASTLDLFEAEIQYGYNIIKSDAHYMDQAVDAIKRIGSSRGEKFTKQLIDSANFIDKKKRILTGVKLKDINDSFEIVTPTNCKIEQAAIFIDQENILFNGEIWNSLDETNKASLIVHETIYYLFRSVGAKNSVHARKAVGYAFTGLQVEKISDKFPINTQVCSFNRNNNEIEIPTKYYIYKDPQDPNWNIIELDTFDGIFMLTKTYFRALAPAFDSLGSFNEYFTTIEHSNIMMGLNVGFKDETVITNNTVHSTRFTGIATNFSQPTVPTTCTILSQ